MLIVPKDAKVFRFARIKDACVNRSSFRPDLQTKFSNYISIVNTTRGYSVNLLNPTGHVMHQQFNIQQFYVLPTLYLCVLYSSENKQRLVPLTA